ncbi:MAG: glycosyltransferase [Deltaproteobacteria bacterium]|nr:glycosyltransferase [Deltaproteobacteria bacterium]
MTAESPLRFCLVTTFYPPYNFGGDGVYAHRLANGLARRGHQVTVLHSPSAYELLAGRQPTNQYPDHPNVTVHPVPTPLGKWGLLAVQQTGRPGLQAPALRRWLDGGSFDVIHYNNVSLLGGPHVFRYGRGLKLCTLIEHWLVCPMHVLWKFGREVCTKPSCLRCQLAGRRPPQLWRHTGLMRRATRHIDAFLGPSEFTIAMHRARGLRGTMIQLPLFHPEPEAGPALARNPKVERPYCLFSGRLERIKGVQVIIPVFRALPDVDLLIAGTGDFESELRAMAAGAANIKFLGRIDHDRLQACYRGALATVVPSLCYETFGLIVAESFSTCTPVIVYAQSSLEELVRRHGGGLLYRSPDELRAAVVQLQGDPALRARLGAEGRRAYEAEFAEPAFLDHYLGVTRALLAQKRAGLPLTLPGNAPNLQRVAGQPAFLTSES